MFYMLTNCLDWEPLPFLEKIQLNSSSAYTWAKYVKISVLDGIFQG